MEKILVLHRTFSNFGKKMVKIGKIVSRLAVNLPIKDQISQKNHALLSTKTYMYYITGFCAFRKCMPLLVIMCGLGKKLT